MDLTWVTIIFFYSGLCGVSAYVPHRYHFVNDLKNRTDAQEHCREIYTDLATINNMEEMKKINTTLSAVLNSSRSAWIGLERVQNTSWQWSLADKILEDTYKNWNDGEPNNCGGQEFCVMIKYETGKWIDDNCDHQFTFVCYDEKNTARFIFINETKTWYEAQTYCRQYYTDLASVRNLTDNQQVWDLSNKSSNSHHFWIGLFYDSWQWSDRSPSSFRYWSSGPNTLTQNQDCAAISGTGQRYWHNSSCKESNPFICHENKLKLVQQNLTWRAALRYCREKHVDLVSVHSEEIQLWVKEVAEKASTEHVWVGLRHTCTLGFWFWVSGESICYENWAPVNGTEGEDCSPVERTGAVQSGEQQQWVSLPETHKLNFICIIYED